MWTAERVLVCALVLLGRGADSLPQIVLLDTAIVRVAERGRARHASRPCGEVQALRIGALVALGAGPESAVDFAAELLWPASRSSRARWQQ